MKSGIFKICSAVMLLTLLFSCNDRDKNFPGDLPDTPVNLSEFNSQYDDYNSAAPVLGHLIPFCFSTNRNTLGLRFDVICTPMNIQFDRKTGILEVMNNLSGWEEMYGSVIGHIRIGLDRINSPVDELGPNLLIGYDWNDRFYTLLYASDDGGNFDIRFSSSKSDPSFTAPKPVTFLNSPSNDLYPAFNTANDRIYFCSDRDGAQFDIWYASIDPGILDPEILLSDTTKHQVVKETVISSASDDKCPFILGYTLVFASNRPGGYGGFDLYRSWFDGLSWSQPQNLGPVINSPYNEYRPILLEEGVSETEIMMIFSSDRPGGKGGYDLWYVGIR
jgi:hypothetical protein